MSTQKLNQTTPRKQAVRSIPLAEIQIEWTEQDFAGAGKTRTLDGEALARLLHSASSFDLNENTIDDGYLEMNLDALRGLTAALSECPFEIDEAEGARQIFLVISKYCQFIKLERQWGDKFTIRKILDSASITTIGGAGGTVEEDPE